MIADHNQTNRMKLFNKAKPFLITAAISLLVMFVYAKAKSKLPAALQF